jgi:hypothetical protein
MRMDFIVPVKAALGIAALFKRAMDSVDADLKSLARALHEAKNK